MQTQHGVAPNAVLCNTLLAGCSRRGDWLAAKEFLHTMQSEHGVVPNTKSYRYRHPPPDGAT